jgi:electron transport complex protein RnfB
MVAIIVFSILSLIIGLILAFSAKHFRVEGNPMVDKINAILPQTQCGQCNFPGCKPYAEAIANEEAPINQCPPGGQEGVDALANLLNIETLSLNEDNGIEKPKQVAVIIEELCIGCTLCIQACPVDAILGASKVMTTVIAVECTGCDLCVPPCPVDCIEMIDVKDKAVL